MLLRVNAFGEFLHGFGAERFQVVWVAAGDESFVDYDFIIDPLAAGVADVGLQTGV